MKRKIRLKIFCILMLLVFLMTYPEASEVYADTGAFGYGTEEGYAIIPLHAGSTCLDLVVAEKKITIHKAHRGENQTWKLRQASDGYYMIENLATGTVLEVSGDTAANGTWLTASEKNGSERQLWKLAAAGDGTYAIKTKLDERFCLDVEGFYTDSGSRVHIWEYNYQKNQRFRFAHMTTIEDMSDWGASYSDCRGTDWDIWDGSSDNRWYYADTNASLYYIKTGAELAGLAQLVRDGVCSFDKRVIALTKDLNLAGIEWPRIGDGGRAFCGSFNGNGHAVTGLSITQTNSESGLFGQLDGGSITNLRVKGSVAGDFNTGGVVGMVTSGHVVNVYSEVTLTRSLDDNLGGIAGRLGYNGYIEHCTQNARINSGDRDPDRGGIAGYAPGLIRYCVNKSSVYCDWNYVGGIAGECPGGKIELCANYGTISGGGDTKWCGGIAGATKNDAVIFGCYNEGDVWSDDDDYVGGICGQRCDDSRIYCCINLGNIWGDDRVGGINGEGMCRYCFNAGRVIGDDNTGSVSGSATQLHWCRALAWTSPILEGDGPDYGAVWNFADEVIGGKTCYELNAGEGRLDMEGYGVIYNDGVFRQNIGGDMFPTFSGQKVRLVNGEYVNGEYEVRTVYEKNYGTVKGGGAYASGAVTLKAEPADGCVFDHFEASRAETYTKPMHDGDHDYPRMAVETYTDPEITLTQDIDRSYEVRAVFAVYDDTPEELKTRVRIELECMNDADGWNGSIIPVYLVDSSGERHLWEIPQNDINGEGKKTERTFNLGAASPVYLEAWPDFGGGFTFRTFSLRARMWINDSESGYTSGRVTIRSYPFVSSKYNNDYMHIAFRGSGRSTVGILKDDGSIEDPKTYETCSEGWEAAKKLGSGAVIRLESAWLTEKSLEVSGNDLTLDLNGFPVIRSMKQTFDNGEVIKINNGAKLHIIDSAPTRKSCSAFPGGSLQGGRSKNGAGILEVRGELAMDGGTLYNGGTTDVGGAVKVTGGKARLTGTLISDCWSNMAWIYDNNGGALALRENGKAELKDVTIRNCTANEKGGAIHINSDGAELVMENVTLTRNRCNDDEGGAVYQDGGSIRYVNGTVNSNSAADGDGGAIFQNKGTLYCENVLFDRNSCGDSGGALCINTRDQTWLLNCTFTNNYAGEDGGAICQAADYLYIRDASITGNGCREKGGGIFVKQNSGGGSVDVSGKVIIRNNDGAGTMDNLVLQVNAYLYDQGLTAGSEVHLRSTSDDAVSLSDPNMTEAQRKTGNSYRVDKYQLRYFVSDHKLLRVTDTVSGDTGLVASVFSERKTVIYITAGLAAAAVLAGVFILLKRKKEGK